MSFGDVCELLRLLFTFGTFIIVLLTYIGAKK